MSTNWSVSFPIPLSALAPPPSLPPPPTHLPFVVSVQNSHVGMALETICSSPDPSPFSSLRSELTDIQSRLLDVGSSIATPVTSASRWKAARTAFPEEHVTTLEGWIDTMDDQLPQLTTFILPGGGPVACQLHVARTVCRRAERSALHADDANHALAEVAVEIKETETETEGKKEKARPHTIDGSALRYLNRLSDYLFTAARFAALRAGREETTYRKV